MTEVDPPSTSPAAPGGDEIGLAEIVGFFQRQWLIIGLGAGLAALVTVVYLGLFVHPLYTSTAILVIVSPTVAPEPEPGKLSLQGYQRLLDSGAVRAQTSYNLQEAQVLEPEEPFRLESQIFISRRQETTALAPVLELVGFAHSPEKAATIANTWAEVFIDLTRELAASATAASVEVVGGELAEALKSLEEKESELLALENRFQNEHGQRASAWNRALAAARAKTADLIAEHQNGSRVLLSELLEARLGERVGSLQVTQPAQAKLRQLAAVRSQLAQTPPLMILEARTSAIAKVHEGAVAGPVVVLERTMREESAPEKLTLRSPKGVPAGTSVERTEVVPEIDPIYGELVTRATELELELRELVTEDWPPVAALAVKLERLQRERLAGLEKLREERAAELAALDRKRQGELDPIVRERRSQVTGIRRSLAELEGLVAELGAARNEAILSRVGDDVGAVRIAASAVPTGRREPRQIRLRALLAALGGGVLGFVVALFREFGAAGAGRA